MMIFEWVKVFKAVVTHNVIERLQSSLTLFYKADLGWFLGSFMHNVTSYTCSLLQRWTATVHIVDHLQQVQTLTHRSKYTIS